MLRITDDAREELPALTLRWAELRRDEASRQPEEPSEDAFAEARERSLTDVKADPVAQAYRTFFWDVDVDPTKRRPAGEALARRFAEQGLPEIHPLVDAYNRASAATLVALSAFDREALDGDLLLDVPREGDALDAIGETEPVLPVGRQPVWRDDGGVVGLAAYRDGQRTALGSDSDEALVVALAPPEVPDERIEEAFALVEALAEPAGWRVEDETP